MHNHLSIAVKEDFFFSHVTWSNYPDSQNHRMVEVGRDLWRSSSTTPLLKQGPLKQVAQDLDP